MGCAGPGRLKLQLRMNKSYKSYTSYRSNSAVAQNPFHQLSYPSANRNLRVIKKCICLTDI